MASRASTASFSIKTGLLPPSGFKSQIVIFMAKSSDHRQDGEEAFDRDRGQRSAGDQVGADIFVERAGLVVAEQHLVAADHAVGHVETIERDALADLDLAEHDDVA